MKKTAVFAIVAIAWAVNSAFAQTAYKILAVDTNTGVANYSTNINFPGGLSGPRANTSSNYVPYIQLQELTSDLATRTNLYNVTGSVSVSNSASFIIPLLYSPAELADCRFYLSTTNGAPVSRRAKIAISQKANNRCNDLIYMYTNQLYYSTISTVAGVADTYTNVVGDASGFIINDMYVKPLVDPVTWQTVSNYTSTVVAWNCSNMVNETTGTLISHVNRFQLSNYMDRGGGTNLYVRIDWTSPYTNTIGYDISYYRR